MSNSGYDQKGSYPNRNNYNNNNNNNNKNNNNGDNHNDKKGPKIGQVVIILLIAFVLTYFATTFLKSCIKNATTKEISYTRFLEMIEEDSIKSVEYTADTIIIVPKEQAEDKYIVEYYTGYIYDEEVFNRLKQNKDIQISARIEDTGSGIFDFILMYILPFVLIYLVLGFAARKMMGSGGVMGVGNQYTYFVDGSRFSGSSKVEANNKSGACVSSLISQRH